MHNNISCIKINSFDPRDSLAVLIDLHDFKLAIACIYRSQSITYNDNLLMIQEIKNLQKLTPTDTQLMVVGDFNLPNVSWDNGSVICPTETKNKQFTIQQKYINMFLETGLHWHLPSGTITRRRLYNGELQESHLDQILTADPAIISSVEIKPALGKSDHLSILSTIRSGNIPGYIRSKRKCWSKMSVDKIVEIGSLLDWSTPPEKGINPSLDTI